MHCPANKFAKNPWKAHGVAISLLLAAALAVARAADPRITLEDAVKSTLRRDPNIQVQEEQVKFAQGAVVREAGAFDYTLETSLSQGVVRTPRTVLERMSIAGKTTVTETVAD